MADYISTRKRRNTISQISYVLLNIALAIISTLVTVISGSWVFGVLLVIFSKWRVFAVRPRYWWPGIKANLVDLIVGVSIVLLTYFAWDNFNSSSLANPLYLILTIVYILWLVFLKPRSDEKSTELQALAAIFLGSSVVTLIATGEILGSIFVTVATFIISFFAIRHVLVQAEDAYQPTALANFSFALLLSELAWVSFHWTRVYSINLEILPIFQLPQVAIVETVFAFLFIRAYKSFLRHDGKITSHDILAPLIFSVLILLVMLIFFSDLDFIR